MWRLPKRARDGIDTMRIASLLETSPYLVEDVTRWLGSHDAHPWEAKTVSYRLRGPTGKLPGETELLKEYVRIFKPTALPQGNTHVRVPSPERLPDPREDSPRTRGSRSEDDEVIFVPPPKATSPAPSSERRPAVSSPQAQAHSPTASKGQRTPTGSPSRSPSPRDDPPDDTPVPPTEIAPMASRSDTRADSASPARKRSTDPNLPATLVRHLREIGLYPVIQQCARGYYAVDGPDQPLNEAVLACAMKVLDDSYLRLSADLRRERKAREVVETRLEHSELLVKMLLKQGAGESHGVKCPRDA